MPVTIGSNISSLNAIRRLDQASDARARVFERLSSGARINRAADDPAGLNVSSVLNSKARVLSRARLNLSDASSVLSIADGALSQVSILLSRMAELAEQAANGTFSASQRASLDREFVALDREIRRQSVVSSFNGINLLEGGRANRASRTLAGDEVSTWTALRISGDARYVGYSRDATFLVQDVDTGENIEIATPTGQTSITDIVGVLANGDAVLRASDGVTTNLFYWSRETGQSRQLTSGATGQSEGGDAVVSADGSTVVFTSRTRYSDGGSALQNSGSGAFRMTFIDIASSTVRQAFEDQASSTDVTQLVVSSDGRYAAATGVTDQTLRIFDREGSSILARTISSTFVNVRGVTNQGDVILEGSTNFYGQNATGLNQFMIYQYASDTARRLTNFTSAVTTANNILNVSGDTLYFTSTQNLIGQNSSLTRQLFSLDTTTGELEQRTNYSTSLLGLNPRFVSSDGNRVINSSGLSIQMVDTSRAEISYDFEAGFGSRGNILSQLQALTSAVRGLGAYTLSSAASARAALDRMRENLFSLSQLRGNLGALQSRLNIAEQLAASQAEVTRAAEGRIRDADIAQESAEATRFNIAVQIGSALLAQANQQPALALTLLRS